MNQEVVLQVTGLNKSFGITHANIDVDFTLHKGEVVGLAGENGSGKSTLLSQIAGMYSFDSGTMELFGKPYAPTSPLDANNSGIAIVVQELGVIPVLPAAENVFIGRTDRFKTCGFISSKKLLKAVDSLCEKWDLPKIQKRKICGNMNVESRKMVELLRALSVEPDILILDEVTQALSLNNRQRLYKVIEKYKELGKSVILISHDLDEMVNIVDTVTVLRDGRVVGTSPSSDITVDQLKKMMIGRQMEGDYYRNDNEPSRTDNKILEVKNLRVADEVAPVSFDVYAGEIVGFCGLSDSGIHTVGKALYGLADERTGHVLLVPDGCEIHNSQTALKHKVAYVPKERDGEGLMIQASIKDNFCLPDLSRLEAALGFLNPSKLNKCAETSKVSFEVKCQDIFQRMNGLSGGNKQKINLGRWMAKDIQLLILDCPTRGVDIGVKAYIYGLMKQAKADGVAIVLISDELTEVLGMADRLFVFNNGKMTKEICRGPEFTEEKIIEVMI